MAHRTGQPVVAQRTPLAAASELTALIRMNDHSGTAFGGVRQRLRVRRRPAGPSYDPGCCSPSLFSVNERPDGPGSRSVPGVCALRRLTRVWRGEEAATKWSICSRPEVSSPRRSTWSLEIRPPSAASHFSCCCSGIGGRRVGYYRGSLRTGRSSRVTHHGRVRVLNRVRVQKSQSESVVSSPLPIT